MFDALSRDERLLLLRFACAFAWTDLEVTAKERAFVRRLVERLELIGDEAEEVEGWLDVARSSKPSAPSSTLTATSTPKSDNSSNGSKPRSGKPPRRDFSHSGLGCARNRDGRTNGGGADCRRAAVG